MSIKRAVGTVVIISIWACGDVNWFTNALFVSV